MEPDSPPVRKTKSVVKRALGDILRPVLPGLRVLDLFAGSGEVGVSLLEERVDEVYAVDRRPAPEDLPEDLQWLRRDVPEFLRQTPLSGVGLVFMDPPYDSDYPETLLPELESSGILAESGIVAVETRADRTLPVPVGDLALRRHRSYGGSALWIYQLE